MVLDFEDADEFLKAYNLDPEKVKTEIRNELDSLGIKADQIQDQVRVDEEYSNVVLGGKIHLVTPKDVAKSKIQEILEKLKNSGNTYDPDA